MQLRKYPALIPAKNLENVSTKVELTRWVFWGLCCYLLSQCYTIPILPIGPWAGWLNFADISTGLMAIAFLLNYRHLPQPSDANRRIFHILIFVLFGSIISYLFFASFADRNGQGVKFGIFQIYRLVEFISIFWITARIPLTPKRINILRWIVDIALAFVCLGVFLTFFSIVPLDALTTHLPQSKDVAGPWSSYWLFGSKGISRGWGTIGYNHAYVAAQVLMLVSLKIHLSHSKSILSNTIFLLISISACFVSESRAGLATILLFALIYWLKQPLYVFARVIAILLGIIPLMGLFSVALKQTEAADDSGGSIVDRQLTLLDAKNSDNLSGRDEIWLGTITSLDEDPIRWIFGAGFGAAPDFAGEGAIAAHMLYLQIVLETGVIGLCIFAVLFFQILALLYQNESGTKAIFWVTVAFLMTSVSQDTFYPVAALGHFLGFYLCSVAIALRDKPTVNTQGILSQL